MKKFRKMMEFRNIYSKFIGDLTEKFAVNFTDISAENLVDGQSTMSVELTSETSTGNFARGGAV